MSVAVDSNVLGYAAGIDDVRRQAIALRALRSIEPARLVIPAQALAELFSVISRKTRRLDTAQQAVRDWTQVSHVVPTSAEVIAAGCGLAVRHRLQIFDAVILAATASAGAELLLSEDMQDGFCWRGVTVVNPFADPPHPLVGALLR